MKLAPARLPAFLRAPDPQIRAVLLYGPDAGLVQERAATLVRAICPDPGDPFRVAELFAAALAADPARLFDEVAAISLTGGRRVIRVRETGDALAALFARFLGGAAGDGFVVVEAGDLPARSTLRRAFDDAGDAAAVGCYPDSARDLAQVIRETLAAQRITLDGDAGAFLAEHLGGDRLLTRSELEKLALYAGEGGRIELDDARACIADTAAISLDDAVTAAAEGDVAALDRALGRVFAEGESPVAVIRAMLRHLLRLHGLAARLAGGGDIDAVLRAARPPIFFKQQDNFRRQLGSWREPRLRERIAALGDAEAQMKQTGAPAETLCRHALTALAQAARPRR